MKQRHFLIAGLLVLCLALMAVPVLAGNNNNNCYEPPTPVCSNGSVDVKFNAVQGATGVAGIVSLNSCETGIKTVRENTCEVSGSGGVALDKIGKAGAVGVGDFDLTKTYTTTNICETFHTTTNQYTAQNVATMNQQVVVGATNAGMNGTFNLTGNQTFTQEVCNAQLPGGGAVNSKYVGAMAYAITGK
jgi:hypothetical protein